MQRLALVTLVSAVLAVSGAQQGRRWIWPSSDAERFPSLSFQPLGGSPFGQLFGQPFGRSLGAEPPRRRLPPGAGTVSVQQRPLQNRLVTSGGGGGRCPLISGAACPPRHVLLSNADEASLLPCSNDTSCPRGTRCCYHPCLTLSLCLTPGANVVPRPV